MTHIDEQGTPPPVVSVPMPSYNHREYISQAIESVLAQSFTDWELIIVDDGSQDGSYEIAKAYEALYPTRIAVLQHPGGANHGISTTYNVALSACRGRYVAGLPSDDVFWPDKLARQVRLMEAEPDLACIWGQAQAIGTDGGPLVGESLVGGPPEWSQDPVMCMLERNLVPGMSLIARRDSVVETGPQHRDLVYGDWEWNVRLMQGRKARFVPGVVAGYRVHRHNTSIGNDWSVDLQREVEVLDVLAADADGTRAAAWTTDQKAMLQMRRALNHFGLGDAVRAGEALDSAIRAQPSLATEPWFSHWIVRRPRDLLDLQPVPADLLADASLVLGIKNGPGLSPPARLVAGLRDRGIRLSPSDGRTMATEFRRTVVIEAAKAGERGTAARAAYLAFRLRPEIIVRDRVLRGSALRAAFRLLRS